MIDILQSVQKQAQDSEFLSAGRSLADFMLSLESLEHGLEQQFNFLRQNLLSRPDTMRVFQRYLSRILPHYQDDGQFGFIATKPFDDIFMDYHEDQAPQFQETNAQITITRAYHDSTIAHFSRLHSLFMTVLTKQTPITEKAPPATLASYEFMLGFAARSDVVGSFASFEYPFGADVPRHLIRGNIYRHPHTFTISIEHNTPQAYDRLRPTIGHGILRRPQPDLPDITRSLLGHFFIDTPEADAKRKDVYFAKFIRPDVFLFDWK